MSTPKDAFAAEAAALAEVRAKRTDDAYAVTWTDEKTPKLLLPSIPAHDDLAGQLAWITSVLRFDIQHPATAAAHQGKRGQDGHVEIRRADAAAMRFEPAGAISSARRLLPMLGWQLLPTDGEPYGFKDDHCRRIAHALRLACGVDTAQDAVQDAAAIIGTFTLRSTPIEGFTTYGTAAQRHEALSQLRPGSAGYGPARYLIDERTGELVVRVSDLQSAAREHEGSSLPHGWLDARMDNLGWARAQLQGFANPGREGRAGPHSRCDVYRGHLPSDEADEADEAAVNT